MNLVVNALDAMGNLERPERFLHLRAWHCDASVHVAVRDSGHGFDPEDVERIFSPFYTTKPDGLGMGLAISRSIIRAHGGELHAALNPEGGATFEFVLPAAVDTTAQPASPTAVGSAAERAAALHAFARGVRDRAPARQAFAERARERVLTRKDSDGRAIEPASVRRAWGAD
jgi:hypothetical protein